MGVLRCQLELTQVRQEIDRRMAEKDEEFLSTKKNMTKAIENMQSAVETEAKAKAEALRMKKKLETDVLDLESNLERANAANADTQRTIKSYQLNLREAQAKLEDQQRAKEVAHDELIVADRKCNSNQNALEEARTLLEQADRTRRMVEQELADTNETLSDQTCGNQAIQAAKMKIEAEMGTLTADLDEMASEAGMSEEKAQRAMIDAARLADELRGEQDLAQSLERERKLLDAQVKDMQSRVDEAQTQALKGGKKAMTKMDTRIRELESELDAENRRMADAQKNMRKSERKIKELTTSRTRTGITTRGFRDSSTSCRARSSPTRSRLRRPRRSPPSTLPSTCRPRTASPMPTSVPTLMSRPSPRTVLGLAAHPLDLCKWKRQERGRRALIYNARDHLPCFSPALSKSHPTLNPLLSHC